jgi:hypothetical protein
MNSDDPNTDFDDRFDGLDEQIRAALDVEPSRQQVARLQDFWCEQSRAASRRRHVRRAALLAAMVLLAVTASLRFWRAEREQKPLANDTPTKIAPTPERPVVVKSAGEEESISAGRSPTAYERLVFTAQASVPVGGSRPSAIAMIDAVVGQLADDPGADAVQLVESSGLTEFDAERLLLRRLSRSSDTEKHSVLRVLAVCGTQRSTPALLQLSRREPFRNQALATIEQIASIEGLANVARHTPDRRVRAAIFRRLFAADHEPALQAYLSLILDDAHRAEALAVADELTDWQREALLTRLSNDDKAVRLSAALVLGQANGPEVTRSLIALVTKEPSSPDEGSGLSCPAEAWIALTACRGEQAENFFAYTIGQPQLLGRIYRARMWWMRTML